ncbi:MAG: chemotaxis protein CheB [Clostridia bacterium]|nr:chemotaxis protein CheB [Deltaproteobacteria bacterium]
MPTILGQLPVNCAVPIIVVQHVAPAFADHFCAWIAESTHLPLQEARAGEELAAGTIYMILRGPSLELDTRYASCLVAKNADARKQGPAVDALFFSAARVFGPNAFAALLSGMGDDGARGLKAIADAGGHTVVQSEESAVYKGMPHAATSLTQAHEVLSRDAIALALASATRGKPRLPWVR